MLIGVSGEKPFFDQSLGIEVDIDVGQLGQPVQNFAQRSVGERQRHRRL